MDAKRWPPLWVFAGGCLTGAALIGVRSGGDGSDLPSDSRDPDRRSEFALPSEFATPTSKPEEPTPATHSARPATQPGAAAQTDTADARTAEAGNSVADVLARLEAEYRQRIPPARTSDVSPPGDVSSPPGDDRARALPNAQPREVAPAADRSMVSAATAPKLSDARLAALPSGPRPALAAAEKAPQLSTSLQDFQSNADSRQQQVSFQIQELAVLQQATLAQQFTLLQVLQLLSVSSAPPRAFPLPPQRRTRNARIVPGFPSSISDTDNPWGFDFPRAVLVR